MDPFIEALSDPIENPEKSDLRSNGFGSRDIHKNSECHNHRTYVYILSGTSLVDWIITFRKSSTLGFHDFQG